MYSVSNVVLTAQYIYGIIIGYATDSNSLVDGSLAEEMRWGLLLVHHLKSWLDRYKERFQIAKVIVLEIIRSLKIYAKILCEENNSQSL